MPSATSVLTVIVNVLTFRFSLQEIRGFNRWHLIAGLLGTWVVGMGRYWDDYNAELLQHLGVGSVVYVFVLATLLYPFILGIGTGDLTYFRLLTFITLTSFPAILYAIPVELFVNIETAATLNGWFLSIVALWRFSLLIVFLRVIGPMNWFIALVTSLAPVMMIIAALFTLNLHHLVFDFMAGFREKSAHDGAYMILMILTFCSFYAFIPTLLIYSGCAIQRRRKAKALTLAEVDNNS